MKLNSFLKYKIKPHNLLILLVIISSITIFNIGQDFYSSLGVPALKYPFGDFNTIKYSFDLYSQGLDLMRIKYLENTTIFNYPPIWVKISEYLNLKNSINSYAVLFVFILSYLFVMFYITKKTSSFIPILFLFSGSSLLLIERGNSDLLIIFLVFLIANNKRMISNILYLVASILKIYPVVILAFLSFKKSLRIILALPIIIYLLIIKDDLVLISEATPMSSSTSYGSLVFSIILERYLGIEINHLFISVLLILTVSMIYFYVPKIKFKKSINNDIFENMFICGALIYCSSFLVASNWDYRLCFLFLCYPYINLRTKKIHYSFVILLIISCHYTILYNTFWLAGSLINQTSKLLLFLFLGLYLFDLFYKKAFDLYHDFLTNRKKKIFN